MRAELTREMEEAIIGDLKDVFSTLILNHCDGSAYEVEAMKVESLDYHSDRHNDADISLQFLCSHLRVEPCNGMIVEYKDKRYIVNSFYDDVVHAFWTINCVTP